MEPTCQATTSSGKQCSHVAKYRTNDGELLCLQHLKKLVQDSGQEWVENDYNGYLLPVAERPASRRASNGERTLDRMLKQELIDIAEEAKIAVTGKETKEGLIVLIVARVPEYRGYKASPKKAKSSKPVVIRADGLGARGGMPYKTKKEVVDYLTQARMEFDPTEKKDVLIFLATGGKYGTSPEGVNYSKGEVKDKAERKKSSPNVNVGELSRSELQKLKKEELAEYARNQGKAVPEVFLKKDLYKLLGVSIPERASRTKKASERSDRISAAIDKFVRTGVLESPSDKASGISLLRSMSAEELRKGAVAAGILTAEEAAGLRKVARTGVQEDNVFDRVVNSLGVQRGERPQTAKNLGLPTTPRRTLSRAASPIGSRATSPVKPRISPMRRPSSSPAASANAQRIADITAEVMAQNKMGIPPATIRQNIADEFGAPARAQSPARRQSPVPPRRQSPVQRQSPVAARQQSVAAPVRQQSLAASVVAPRRLVGRASTVRRPASRSAARSALPTPAPLDQE